MRSFFPTENIFPAARGFIFFLSLLLLIPISVRANDFQERRVAMEFYKEGKYPEAMEIFETTGKPDQGNTPEFYMLTPSGSDFQDITNLGNLSIR